MRKGTAMILTVFLSVLGAGVALAGGAASGDALAEKVHAAISAKNAEAISALYNWEGGAAGDCRPAAGSRGVHDPGSGAAGSRFVRCPRTFPWCRNWVTRSSCRMSTSKGSLF